MTQQATQSWRDLKQTHMVAFDKGTSLFGVVRCNLEKEGNLKAVFAQNPCELVMIMKKLPEHD